MSTRTSPDAPSGVGVAPTRATWLLPLLVLLGTFLVFVGTSARDYSHIDAHAATVESWRIAHSGTPWLEGQLDEQMRRNPFISQAPNGHVVGQRMAGPVLAGVPFYLVLDAVTGTTDFTHLPGGVAAAAWSALTVLLLFGALRSRLGVRWSLAGSAVLAFGTPTWSVSANMLWTHTVTQLGIAGAAYALSRGRLGWAGVLLGVGMLGRPHLAVVAAVVGLGLAVTRRSWRPLAALGLPTVTTLGVLGLWNRMMFGEWSVGGAYAGRGEGALAGFQGSAEWDGAYPQLVNYLGFLLAPDRGLLVWTPILLLLLVVLARSWRHTPDWSRWLALGGVLYTVLQLRLNYFPGGDYFYGYRHGLELVTCLAPVLAFAAVHAGRRMRGALVVVAALQVGVISLGAISEQLWVPLDDVWVDSALWVGLRSDPGLVACWLLGSLLVGVALARMAIEPTAAVPTPGPAVGAPGPRETLGT